MRRLRLLSCLPLLGLLPLALGAVACSSSSGSLSEGPPIDAPPPADAGPTTTVAGESVPFAHSALERTPASTVSAADLSAAVTANNAFAVSLYSQFRATSSGTNLLTSPLSASIALTMTYAGAQGTTATQMATALQYGGAQSSIFAGQNALSQALASRAAAAFSADTAASHGGTPPSASDYELQVVNSVWGETGYPWQTPFLNILGQDYGTGVYQEDFETSYDTARALINTWVSDETNNKIENLLPEGSLDNLTRMVLVNAVHLKLPWAYPFSVSETANAPSRQRQEAPSRRRS
jgi:serpin B